MADVRVKFADYDSQQAPETPFPVEIGINNRETVGPAGWGPQVCPDSGLVNNGHMTDVTLKIREDGNTVWEETQGLCVPVNRPSELVTANAIAEFQPELSAGNYSVHASVQVRGGNGSDTLQPKSLTVSGDSGSLPDGDANRWPWDGGDGGDSPGWADTLDGDAVPDEGDGVEAIFGFSPLELKLVGGAVGLLVVLVLLAPYAKAGATLMGGRQ